MLLNTNNTITPIQGQKVPHEMVGRNQYSREGASLPYAFPRGRGDKTKINITWHGRRDFLIGNDFLKKTNIESLEDPTLIQLGDKKAIVLHGDTLCSDDKDYQIYRSMVRSSEWQKEFLNQSIKDRLEICNDLRKKSKEAQEKVLPYFIFQIEIIFEYRT